MIWRTIPGFPEYQVSNLGVVRAGATKRVLSTKNLSDSGYERVSLRGRLVRVHRLVLFAFRGPPPSPHHHGAHKNGDKRDNRARNLLWKLPVANEADKKKHGTARGGGKKRRPPARVVSRIVEAVSSGESFTRVAAKHGLHRSSVSRYARGIRRAAG